MSYSYSTSATDSDIGDTLTYTFDWGDGTTNVTNAVAPGTSVSQNHTWSTAGTYLVKAMATDSNGVSSGWSGTLSVTIKANAAPTTPTTPSGPISGLVGSSYSYSTSATDSDIGDTLTYTFDWGDGTTNVTGAVASGTPVSQTHIWSTAGTYLVKAMATDSNGVSSDWSGTISVTIKANAAPTTPTTPSGPISGLVGSSYSYSTSATDSDIGDTLTYTFDWGDTTTTRYRCSRIRHARISKPYLVHSRHLPGQGHGNRQQRSLIRLVRHP